LDWAPSGATVSAGHATGSTAPAGQKLSLEQSFAAVPKMP